MITTLAILLLFQTVGEGLAHAFDLPVPGPVIGMLLLFLYLVVRPGILRGLAPTSLSLLKHLSLLFVPAGVGIMVHAQRLATEWIPIGASLAASTVVSIAVTALVVKWLQKPADPSVASLRAGEEADYRSSSSFGTRSTRSRSFHKWFGK